MIKSNNSDNSKFQERLDSLRERCKMVEKEVESITEEMNLLIEEHPNSSVKQESIYAIEGWVEMLKSFLLRHLPTSYGFDESASKRMNKDALALYPKLDFDKEMAHKEPATTIICVPYSNGHRLISGSLDKSIKVWKDNFTCENTFKVNRGAVTCLLHFSQHGRVRIASGSDDGTVYIWSFVDWRPVTNFLAHKQGVLAIQFIPDFQGTSALVTAGKKDRVKFWSLDSGEAVCTHSVPVYALDIVYLPQTNSLLMKGDEERKYLKEMKKSQPSQKENEDEKLVEPEKSENNDRENSEEEQEEEEESEENTASIMARVKSMMNQQEDQKEEQPDKPESEGEDDNEEEESEKSDKSSKVEQKENSKISDPEEKEISDQNEENEEEEAKDSESQKYNKKEQPNEGDQEAKGDLDDSWSKKQLAMLQNRLSGWDDDDEDQDEEQNDENDENANKDEENENATNQEDPWADVIGVKLFLLPIKNSSDFNPTKDLEKLDHDNWTVVECITPINYSTQFSEDYPQFAASIKRDNIVNFWYKSGNEWKDKSSVCSQNDSAELAHLSHLYSSYIAGGFKCRYEGDDVSKIIIWDFLKKEQVKVIQKINSFNGKFAYIPQRVPSIHNSVFAFGTRSNEVKYVDMNTREVVCTKNTKISSYFYDKQELLAYLGFESGAVQTWQFLSSERDFNLKHQIYKHENPVVSIMPFEIKESSYIVTSCKKEACIWERSTRNLLLKIALENKEIDSLNLKFCEGKIYSVLKPKDSNKIFIKSQMKKLKLAQLKETHTGTIMAKLFVPVNDNNYKTRLLITATNGGIIRVWDFNTGEPLNSVEAGENALHSVEYLPSNDNEYKVPLLVSSGAEKKIKVWNINTLELLFTLEAEGKEVKNLTYIASSQNARKTALLVYADIESRLVVVVDFNSKQILYKLEGLSNAYNKCYIPPADNGFGAPLWVATGFSTHFYVYNLDTGEKTQTFREGNDEPWNDSVEEIFYVPYYQNKFNETLIVTGNSMPHCKVMNIRTGETLQTLSGHSDRISSMIYVPPNENPLQAPLVVSCGRDSIAKVWNIETGELIRELNKYGDKILSLLFVPSINNNWKVPVMLVGTATNTKFFNLDTGELLTTFAESNYKMEVIQHEYFNTSWNVLLAYADKTFNFYNLNNFDSDKTFSQRHDNQVFILHSLTKEFTQDEPLLVSVSTDNLLIQKLNGRFAYDSLDLSKIGLKADQIKLIQVPANQNVLQVPILIFSIFNSLRVYEIKSKKFYDIDMGCLITSLLLVESKDSPFNIPIIIVGTRDYVRCISLVKKGDVISSEIVFEINHFCMLPYSLRFIPANENKYNTALLAVSRVDLRCAQVYDLATQNLILETERNMLMCDMLSYIPPGDEHDSPLILTTSTKDTELFVTDLNTKKYHRVNIKQDPIEIIIIPANDNQFNARLIITILNASETTIFKADDGKKLFTLKNGICNSITGAYVPSNNGSILLPILVVGYNDQSIWGWNVNSGEAIFTIDDLTGHPKKLVYIPPESNDFNSPVIINAFKDGTIHIYPLSREELSMSTVIQENSFKNPVLPYGNSWSFGYVNKNSQLSFNDLNIYKSGKASELTVDSTFSITIKNEEFLVVASEKDRFIKILDIQSYSELKSFKNDHPGKVSMVQDRDFNDQILLLCGYEDGSVTIYDYDKETLLKSFNKIYNYPVSCLSGFIFNSEKFIVTGDRDGVIKVMDFEGNLKFEPPTEDEIVRLIVPIEMKDKHYLMGVYEKSIRIWTMAYHRKENKNSYTNFVLHNLNK